MKQLVWIFAAILGLSTGLWTAPSDDAGPSPSAVLAQSSSILDGSYSEDPGVAMVLDHFATISGNATPTVEVAFTDAEVGITIWELTYDSAAGVTVFEWDDVDTGVQTATAMGSMAIDEAGAGAGAEREVFWFDGDLGSVVSAGASELMGGNCSLDQQLCADWVWRVGIIGGLLSFLRPLDCAQDWVKGRLCELAHKIVDAVNSRAGRTVLPEPVCDTGWTCDMIAMAQNCSKYHVGCVGIFNMSKYCIPCHWTP